MRALQITHLNQSKGFTYSRHVERLDETFFGENAKAGEIFRECQKEFGRCTSKVYVDKGEPLMPTPVGWTFEKLEKYEDSDEYFLRETWVIIGEYRPAIMEGVT